MYIFINYKQNAIPDHEFAVALEKYLKSLHHIVFRDETKLKGGNIWPNTIQENIKNADVIIALISNSSMLSPWVINEIDEAIAHKKHLIPVLLETLDSSINFTRYRPRFLDIQYIVYKREKESVLQEISDALACRNMKVPFYGIIDYSEIITKTMASYNIENAIELFSYYFEHLQNNHISFAASAELDNTNLISMTGKKCRTMVEGMLLDIQEFASVHEHNYKNHLKKPPENKRERLSLEWHKKRAETLLCFSDIARQLLEKWQPFVESAKRTFNSNIK